jgi:hypothetical protein
MHEIDLMPARVQYRDVEAALEQPLHDEGAGGSRSTNDQCLIHCDMIS